MKKMLIIFLGVVVLGIAVSGAVIVYAAANTRKPCTGIAAVTGKCTEPNMLETLKAMPTYTAGPTDTPGPTPTSCGGLCWPTPEPKLDGAHMIYPHPEPFIGPRPVYPGQLRPVGPGYPYDVRA